MKRNTTPYFTDAKFASICPETQKPIKKGEQIAYFPAEKKAYHSESKHGEQIRALEFAQTYQMQDSNW